MKKITVFVLVYLVRRGKVCLPLKGKNKRKIAIDKKIGYGGKVEKGENILSAAIRELREENNYNIDADPADLIEMAELYISRNGKTNKVHVFILNKWKGEPKSTRTMRDPKWYLKDNLPWDDMLYTDEYWLDSIFEGWTMKVRIKYGKNNQTISISREYITKIVA